jgi:hypothetical protein
MFVEGKEDKEEIREERIVKAKCRSRGTQSTRVEAAAKGNKSCGLKEESYSVMEMRKALINYTLSTVH